MGSVNRQAWVMAFALVTASPWSLAADAKAPPELSAEQIVRRHVEARGGLKAWKAVSAISYAGELDAGGRQAVMLPFTMTLQRPHRSRLEIRFQGKSAVQVFDGRQGWKLRPYLNHDDVEPYSAAEARSAADGDELDGPLVESARKGTRVERAGMEEVAGHPAYKLRLSSKSGTTRHLWIDASTFLEVRMDGEPQTDAGRLRSVSLFYGDFRNVGGLMIPFELKTVVEGAMQPHRMVIRQVTLNPSIAANIFSRPTPENPSSATRP
jgi:outer membrane lipoprotein-sorting protein